FDPARSGRLRRQRIDCESVLRVHRARSRREEGARHHLQNVVGTVAEHDALGRHAKLRAERLLELVAAAVGVARELGDGGRDRGRRLGAHAERVFVRGELDDVGFAQPQLARELGDGLARLIGRDPADVFRSVFAQVHDVRVRARRAPAWPILQSSAMGYEPRIFTKVAFSRISASAAATFSSSWWPSTSTKKRYSQSPERAGLDSNRLMLTWWRASGTSSSYTAPGRLRVVITSEVRSRPVRPTACLPITRKRVMLRCSSSMFSATMRRP